jgi:hypothetical protein
MVLYDSRHEPVFLPQGTGGYFKGKNPNESLEVLKKHWVDGTKVIYIGKAGGEKSSSTLKSRIQQLLKFGTGKNVGHYGGRYIWQLKDSHQLIVCWMPLYQQDQDPREIEKALIHDFKKTYHKRPFANLVD